jgi:hypothetical protein
MTDASAHREIEHRGDVVWQEVDQPDQAAAAARVSEDLNGRVVVSSAKHAVDRGVHQSACIVLAVYQRFALHLAACQGYESVAALEPCVGHEAGGETHVHGTEIANSVPDSGWRGADRDFFGYRTHVISFLQHDPGPAPMM